MFLSDGYALAQLHRAVWNAPVVHGAWHHGASTMLRLRRGTSKTGAEFTPVRPATSF
jgi:hypothetical protein